MIEFKGSNQRLSGGAIEGIVIGAVAVVALVAAAIWYCWFRNPESGQYVAADEIELTTQQVESIPTAAECDLPSAEQVEDASPSLPSASATYSSPLEIAEIRIFEEPV